MGFELYRGKNSRKIALVKEECPSYCDDPKYPLDCLNRTPLRTVRLRNK